MQSDLQSDAERDVDDPSARGAVVSDSDSDAEVFYDAPPEDGRPAGALPTASSQLTDADVAAPDR